ncbi:MAG: hypothetical protein WCB02_00080 [Bradyrhizobium sp.]
MRALRPKLDEYRSSIASFAALNGIALIFLWISRATELHQLAIGIMMSSITLTIAMALFELCWCVGLRVAARRGSEKDKNDN